MDMNTLKTRIYEAALPDLRGKQVTDLVIGLSLLAVELDHREIALAYVLRENLGGGCSIFSYARDAVGMDASEAARWFVTGRDDVQRAIGCAVINAAVHPEALPDTDSSQPFGLNLKPGDTVGMIGNIRPVAMQLKKLGCTLRIFDKGQCSQGNITENLYPMEQQEALLPGCDIVFLSGTTAVNGTLCSLLDTCAQAREIVLMGASTPMVPAGYDGTGVSILAGSAWDPACKQALFRDISLAAGIRGLSGGMIKKNVRIH